MYHTSLFVKFLMIVGVWVSFTSIQLDVVSMKENMGYDSLVWPMDPICGFVAATSVAAMHPEWSCNISGSATSDPCTWDGISCDTNNAISAILMVQQPLTGTLTSQLGNIPTLKSISVAATKISGHLPSSWSSLKAMTYLSLSQNSMSGTLPSSWNSLTAISFLYLNGNSLSGNLPSSWISLTSMIYLFLYQNSLNGTLPSSWNNLTRIHSIDLYQNSFSGTLPSSWSTLTALRDLVLSQNSLSGTLPSSWNSFIRVTYLNLFGNSLSGSLPSSWCSLGAISYVYLSQNHLSGTLPSSWGTLTALRDLYLNQNTFSGFLPSSWSSLAVISVLHLNENSLTGSLPSSWSSLTAMTYLDANQNFLTGHIPTSWGSINSLQYVYLNGNALSGSFPSSWGSLAKLNGLFLFENYLTGPLSQGFDAMAALQYLYLSDNSFSGAIPTAWASNILSTIDISNNALTGCLCANESAYPATLNSINIAFNSLSGTVPPTVALYGNISYLNVSHNDGIIGSIPSEFCSSQGVSIDVTGTDIECYSGCLTSSFILVTGASPECHDGSIMGRFVLITGVFAALVVVCTALYQWYGLWSPALASICNSNRSCGLVWANIARKFCCASTGRASVKASRGSDRTATMAKSYTVFGMAVAKFLLGLVVSLTLNNWWTYSGGRSMARNNEVLASCSNPTVGNCYSYCGDINIITVNITTDDVVFDDFTTVPTAHPIEHVQSDSYCIATLPGYCGYEVWVDLKLLPILLQFVCLVLQVILWRFGSDEFSDAPQTAQYDLILDQLYPQVGLYTVGDLQAHALMKTDFTLTSRLVLLRQLTNPLFLSVFWFLELVTVLYVWGELIFPPVYCGSVPPLSLYYYPILMSLLDLMKLNIYTSVELWKAKRHVESVLILLDLQLFSTHMWLTAAIGLMFIVGVVRDCALSLLWLTEIALGHKEKLKWPSETHDCGTTSVTADSSVNPMLSIELADVTPPASASPFPSEMIIVKT